MPPTFAARWITTCELSRASKQAARSRRSWSAERITLISAPRSSSMATVGRPRKPPPPVTVTRFWAQNAGSGATAVMPTGYPRTGRYRSTRERPADSGNRRSRDLDQPAAGLELAHQPGVAGVPRPHLLPHQAGAPDPLQAELLRCRLGHSATAGARRHLRPRLRQPAPRSLGRAAMAGLRLRRGRALAVHRPVDHDGSQQPGRGFGPDLEGLLP